MSLHELLEQGPSVYVPVILFSLLITLLAYGAFPMIYSRARSQAISSKNSPCIAMDSISSYWPYLSVSMAHHLEAHMYYGQVCFLLRELRS